jgi:hypothetical protein
MNMPITVTMQSKAWKVFAHLNIRIVGSNPTRGMDVCLSQAVVLQQADLPSKESYWLRLRNWSEMKRFMDALCSKWEQLA